MIPAIYESLVHHRSPWSGTPCPELQGAVDDHRSTGRAQVPAALPYPIPSYLASTPLPYLALACPLAFTPPTECLYMYPWPYLAYRPAIHPHLTCHQPSGTAHRTCGSPPLPRKSAVVCHCSGTRQAGGVRVQEIPYINLSDEGSSYLQIFHLVTICYF